MKKVAISILLCLAMMLSACMSAEDKRILDAQAVSRTDLTQFPGLIREPLPINYVLPDGSTIALDGMVTRPDRPGRFPLVLINHGMASDWSERKDEAPNEYTGAAIYFAQRGWVAVTIVRPGYGRSGGSFLESLGPCDARDFHSLSGRMSNEVLSILKTVSGEPWVDPSRILLFGQSGGGYAVLAAAATGPKDVIGVISFAGGTGAPLDGGYFCQPDSLVAEMAAIGKTSQIPSLWLYAENDSLFPPKLARRMFDAYKGAGGPATFVAAPSYRDEGHDYVDAVAQWRPQMDAFLESLHLSSKAEVDQMRSAPPPPGGDAGGDAFFNKYLAMGGYEKAFAVGYNGDSGYAAGYRTIGAAKLVALQECRTRGGGCHIYAIGNQLGE